MADLARIKRNVAKMASMQAPEEDIDGYIASEGVTVEDVRNFKGDYSSPAPSSPTSSPSMPTLPSGMGISSMNIPMGKGSVSLAPQKSNPMQQKVAESQLEVNTQRKKNIDKMNLAREDYAKDLESFLAIDDVLQEARGKGLGRFAAGGKMAVAGIKQDSTLGRAVAVHEGARKRLRVKLVKAAGDVGNINIVEQKAAEMMIMNEWDDADTAKLKKAYLQQIGKAIDSNDGNEVKNVLAEFMKTPVYTSNLVKIKDPLTGKMLSIPKDSIAEFKKDRGIK